MSEKTADITLNQSAAGDLVVLQIVSETSLTKQAIGSILNSIAQTLMEGSEGDRESKENNGVVSNLSGGFNESDSDNAGS